MRRFKSLLGKEIKELITLQMLLPMIIGVAFFMFIGNIMGSENEKQKEPKKVIVFDQDGTTYSKAISETLSKSNFEVSRYTEGDIKSIINKAKDEKAAVVIEIPGGFEKGVLELRPLQVKTYSIIRNFSVLGSTVTRTVKNVLDAMNEYMSDQFIMNKAAVDNPSDLKHPIKTIDFTVIGENQAAINPEEVTGFIMSQTTFIPIIMFIVIMFAAQMIAVTIASEKENKTLETLLSTPVSRISLVSAKMIAAGVVSLLMAAVYMFGMRFYMNGLSGGAIGEAANLASKEAIKMLGLTMSTSSYILLGASLFFSILTALALSLILGAFAEDVKKTQGLIAPLMFLIMIPYFLTMFIDINSASIYLKLIIYAIPFSHPFLASPNLFLGNYQAVLLGIAYQALIFTILVVIAARIFSTDKILTMKLSFGKKKSLFKR